MGSVAKEASCVGGPGGALRGLEGGGLCGGARVAAGRLGGGLDESGSELKPSMASTAASALPGIAPPGLGIGFCVTVSGFSDLSGIQKSFNGGPCDSTSTGLSAAGLGGGLRPLGPGSALGFV